MNGYASYDELKDRAKDCLHGKYGDLILGSFLFFLIKLCVLFVFAFPLLLSVLTIMAFGGSYGTASIRFFQIGLLFVLLLAGFSELGLAYLCLNIVCGQRCYYGDIFYGFHRENLKKALILSVVQTLFRVVFLLPCLYLAAGCLDSPDHRLPVMALLALAAGVALYLPIGLTLETACYLLLDFPDKRIPEILHDSILVIRGSRMRFFLLHCSFLPVYLLCILSMGVGLFWIAPYFGMTKTLFYLDLMEPEETRRKSD